MDRSLILNLCPPYCSTFLMCDYYYHIIINRTMRLEWSVRQMTVIFKSILSKKSYLVSRGDYFDENWLIICEKSARFREDWVQDFEKIDWVLVNWCFSWIIKWLISLFLISYVCMLCTRCLFLFGVKCVLRNKIVHAEVDHIRCYSVFFFFLIKQANN